MRPLLLDTHALLWWLYEPDKLSRRAHALISDPAHGIRVSAASAWEISTKFRLGKLPSASVLVRDIPGWVERAGFLELPITAAHAQRAGALLHPHRDPFDRMIAAQAIEERMPVVGLDTALADLGASLLW